jgi:hypothetical protein
MAATRDRGGAAGATCGARGGGATYFGYLTAAELPPGGWRRMAALLGVPAVPFFRAFSGVRPWMDQS